MRASSYFLLSRSHRASLLVLSLGVAGIAQNGCGADFTSCEAQRTCPSGGQAGSAGGAGAGAIAGIGGRDDAESGLGGAADSGGAAGSSEEPEVSVALGGTGGSSGAALAEAGRSAGSGGMFVELPEAGSGGAGGSSDVEDSCGDGTLDSDEECDKGDENEVNPYGVGKCTTDCKKAPFCGDGFKNGDEACDGQGSSSTELGACNPECSGFYEKKYIRITSEFYPTDLGGVSGADSKCVAEFGNGWKALLVGATRRATVAPLTGDGQLDWVIHKYTHYFSVTDELIWRTDEVALLGVRNGARLNLYSPVFELSGTYPWGGYGSDWRTLDGLEYQGTCRSWSSNSESDGYGSFVTDDLATAASEPCGRQGKLLCVQQ